ncbi:hypothetical protein BDZ97DRAFT_1049576 [Flammula alnicola]|nr:hypothetical protein BDZ97DRAFT_1049576 [Flammula alnicola]
MQPPPNGLRGYSDFFASGFRAVTTRRSSSSRTSSESFIQTASSSSSTRRTLADITPRRLRPTSMIVHTSTPKPREKRRRSSFVSFSSRLFDRMISASGHENSTMSSSSRRSSRSSRFFESTDSSLDVWITAGGPYTPSAPNGSPALHHPIDPFTSSPDARSMFIDLSSDSSPSGTPKRESFLSLTGSSSNRSSLLFARRDRPTSIHTMPLPSRSRRSSLQYRPPPPSQEKSEFFWIVEEEPSLAAEPILEDQDEWDAPAKIDWRQFHIDILTDDATQ